MCIAIAKPVGVALPSVDILKNCWDNNDDGAGFSFAHNQRVFIKKGFMTFEAFMKALTEADKRYNLQSCGALLHFRIATHGAKDQSMTHPFPIIDDVGGLKKIEYVSDYAVIHNGIISLTATSANKSGGLSDTALFIKDYLTKIAQNKAWLRKQANMELIEKLIDSKMAILDKYGNIKLTYGFAEDKGVLYSNTSYKDSYFRSYYNHNTYTSKGNSYSFNDYDDYYDDQDIIADKVDNSKITSVRYKNGLKGLMRVCNGWYVESGEYSDQATADGFPYYIDAHNNLYVAQGGLCGSDEEYDQIYTFLGYCIVYDHALNEVAFRRDLWAYNDQFDVVDDDDCEETEKEVTQISKVTAVSVVVK